MAYNYKRFMGHIAHLSNDDNNKSSFVGSNKENLYNVVKRILYKQIFKIFSGYSHVKY